MASTTTTITANFSWKDVLSALIISFKQKQENLSYLTISSSKLKYHPHPPAFTLGTGFVATNPRPRTIVAGKKGRGGTSHKILFDINSVA